jgi:hypothetical protein
VESNGWKENVMNKTEQIAAKDQLETLLSKVYDYAIGQTDYHMPGTGKLLGGGELLLFIDAYVSVIIRQYIAPLEDRGHDMTSFRSYIKRIIEIAEDMHGR